MSQYLAFPVVMCLTCALLTMTSLGSVAPTDKCRAFSILMRRIIAVTVAILAQGTHWAVAHTQAFLLAVRSLLMVLSAEKARGGQD